MCRFLSHSDDGHGHIIKPVRLGIRPSHTYSLNKAKPSTDRSVLRCFLRLFNVYQRFIHEVAGIPCYLNKVLIKRPLENSNSTKNNSNLFIGPLKRFVRPLLSFCYHPTCRILSENIYLHKESAIQFSKHMNTGLINEAVIGSNHWMMQHADNRHRNVSYSPSVGHCKPFDLTSYTNNSS